MGYEPTGTIYTLNLDPVTLFDSAPEAAALPLLVAMLL